MNTTRPATPPTTERRLVADVGVAVVDELVVDDPVVERLVLGALEAGSELLARVEVGRRPEVEVGSVELVDVVVPAGRCVESAAAPVPGPAVVVGPAVVAVLARAAVVAVAGVNGSSVRAVDRLAEPSAGTVTSGTVAPGTAAPERTEAVPDTGRPGLAEAVPEVAGEDRSEAPPQAANSTAAMP